ncbi:hypothetical protein PhCBS80983_g04174 [Powellomyces hirtus]|uniref:Uncharacterized protein n=1 Tax=Powellomyces hirtus TaxID=109895 RepID=A0A507E0V1_9FUNG|nr:hypothetical protein PhCBS80983_g04174 [Powellomyces hirtus]
MANRLDSVLDFYGQSPVTSNKNSKSPSSVNHQPQMEQPITQTYIPHPETVEYDIYPQYPPEPQQQYEQQYTGQYEQPQFAPQYARQYEQQYGQQYEQQYGQQYGQQYHRQEMYPAYPAASLVPPPPPFTNRSNQSSVLRQLPQTFRSFPSSATRVNQVAAQPAPKLATLLTRKSKQPYEMLADYTSNSKDAVGFFFFPRMPDITVKSFRLASGSGGEVGGLDLQLPSARNNNTFKVSLPVIMRVEARSSNPYEIMVNQLNVSAFVNTVAEPRESIGWGSQQNVKLAPRGLTTISLNFTIAYTQPLGLLAILTDPAVNQFLASCNITAFSSDVVQGEATRIDYATDVTVMPLAKIGIKPQLTGTLGFPCPFSGSLLQSLQDVAGGFKNGTLPLRNATTALESALKKTSLGASILGGLDLNNILKTLPGF